MRVKEGVYWCYRNPHLRCQLYQGCRLCPPTRSPIAAASSHLLPLLLFFSPFLSLIFPSPSLPSSLSLHLICWMQKKEPQCFRTRLLTDRNIWLGGRHTGRKIDSGGNMASGMLCWHSRSLLHPFNVSLPGLPIADMGEVSWKKVSVSLPSVTQSFYSSPTSLLLSIPHPTSLLSSSLHSFLHP